jgi:hypothetical protein
MRQPALAFLAGDRSAETLDALAAGMRAMLRGEVAAPTVGQFRRALRDELLRRAGELIEAPTPGARAEALEERARLFELRRWPRWRHFKVAPPRADPVDVLLFEARQYGEVWLCDKWLKKLLRGTKSPGKFRDASVL